MPMSINQNCSAKVSNRSTTLYFIWSLREIARTSALRNQKTTSTSTVHIVRHIKNHTVHKRSVDAPLDNKANLSSSWIEMNYTMKLSLAMLKFWPRDTVSHITHTYLKHIIKFTTCQLHLELSLKYAYIFIVPDHLLTVWHTTYSCHLVFSATTNHCACPHWDTTTGLTSLMHYLFWDQNQLMDIWYIDCKYDFLVLV